MSEHFEKRFEALMKSQNIGSEVLGDKRGVWIARYINVRGEEIVLNEFASKKEYDEWYDRVGRAIDQKHEGKIRMDFGPSELNPADVESEKASTAKSFEDYMRVNKLEDLVKKEGYVFRVMYRAPEGKEYSLYAEADTADEAKDILEVARELAL